MGRGNTGDRKRAWGLMSWGSASRGMDKHMEENPKMGPQGASYVS